MRSAGLVVVAALLAPLPALPQGVSQQGASQPIRPQSAGQLDSNPTLFAVLAAANAVGYDAGIDSPTNSPLRALVRDRLAKQKLTSIVPLRALLRDSRPRGSGGGTQPLYRVFDFVGRPPEFQAGAVGPASPR